MLRNLTILALCLTMTGCLFTVDSREKSRSNQWNDADLTRIEIGKTDADWVRTAFGNTRQKSTTAKGTEIWRYENVRESEAKVGLFLIFRIDVEREDSKMLAIEFRDGIVTDYWTESSRH